MPMLHIIFLAYFTNMSVMSQNSEFFSYQTCSCGKNGNIVGANELIQGSVKAWPWNHIVDFISIIFFHLFQKGKGSPQRESYFDHDVLLGRCF